MSPWKRSSPLLCALLLLSGLVAVPGCGGDDVTNIINGSGAAVDADFPGTSTGESLVAEDGRAFNNSNAVANKGLNVFWNGANGNAIILYTDKYEHLWAHYFNGTTITPPVELRGPGQLDVREPDSGQDSDDGWKVVEQFRVLFLNTAGASNSNASGRNGDALILWTRLDEDPPSGSGSLADSNDRLYGTYFDASEAGNVASASDATVRYGFETEGTVIDFDNVSDGGDDDVTTFGFVSDSLRFSHAYDRRVDNSTEFPLSDGDNTLAPATRSGDPTTCVWIVWRKAQEDGESSTPERLHGLEFDLTQAGNALPTQGAMADGTLLPDAGQGTLASSSGVNQQLVAHNCDLIWRCDDQGESVGLWLTRFTAGGTPSTIELSASVAGTTPFDGTVPDMPRAEDVYGGDHDLLSLYAFFVAQGGPSEMAAAKSDLAGTLSREVQAIDGLSTSIQRFDGTRISRTREWILVMWQQIPAAVLIGQTSGSREIFANVVQTRHSGASAARTLANSVATAISCPNQSADPAQPDRLILQSEIANGLSDAQCGVQSNRFRINFCWHESGGSTGLQNLLTNGVVATLATSATSPPTAAYAITGAGPAGLIDQNDTGFGPFDSDNGMHPVVADLGTSDGAALVYYLRNNNHATDDGATGAFDEIRVFGKAGIDGQPAFLVSTAGPGTDNALNGTDEDQAGDQDSFYTEQGQYLRVQTTPLSRDIAGSPNFGGTRIHLFWQEPRYGRESFLALRTRYFTKASFAVGTPTSFGTAHTPALSAAPFPLDGVSSDMAYVPQVAKPDGDEMGPATDFITVEGNTLGVYWQSGMHFLYQEFNGTTWRTLGGAGDPIVLDSFCAGGLFPGRDQQGYAFGTRLRSSCDTFGSALLFFQKHLAGDDYGQRRWFARIHE